MNDNPGRLLHKYYSTQRPIDLGTFPKTQDGPTHIINYEKRKAVEQGGLLAWGHLIYTAPLTEKQMDDYELRAAPSNPDRLRLTPEQREQQTQVVGKWEQAKRIPDVKRLTWWYPDFGSFVRKEFVTDEQLSARYNKIIARQKTSIAEQLAKQPEQDRPAPTKHTEQER